MMKTCLVVALLTDMTCISLHGTYSELDQVDNNVVATSYDMPRVVVQVD